jgi:hypothetical protein
MSDWLSFRHDGDGRHTRRWSPGARYGYRDWSENERRAEGRVRARERGKIARLDDYGLAAYLTMQADTVDVSWIARVSYRAARHEAMTVRGWSELPRL